MLLQNIWEVISQATLEGQSRQRNYFEGQPGHLNIGKLIIPSFIITFYNELFTGKGLKD